MTPPQPQKCGCEIVTESIDKEGQTIGERQRIVFCPIHEAAGGMRQALEKIIERNEHSRSCNLGNEAIGHLCDCHIAIAKAPGVK